MRSGPFDKGFDTSARTVGLSVIEEEEEKKAREGVPF